MTWKILNEVINKRKSKSTIRLATEPMSDPELLSRTISANSSLTLDQSWAPKLGAKITPILRTIKISY